MAASLGVAGVRPGRPSRAELASDQIGRNDEADRSMVALARLVFDLSLPTEEAGPEPLVAPDREERWVRKLFERAVLGFARSEFGALGDVQGGRHLEWQIDSASAKLLSILPGMITDVVVDVGTTPLLVIDTKFTAITQRGQYDAERLKSGYIYQMYAYLRSQEGRGGRWEGMSGMLLHPSIGESVEEVAEVQGHRLTFATVDLAAPTRTVIEELRRVLRSAVFPFNPWPDSSL
jgi:5-methylcytosine-specific restriction enzyme subunit McrC